MTPRRGGWDYAQLKTSFLSDSEFQRLRSACRSDRDWLAAIGLWTIALAQAWREDSADVTDIMDDHPAQAERLTAARLVKDGCLAGFAKWTEKVRRERLADANRKRGDRGMPDRDEQTPADSGGLDRKPSDFPRVVGVEVEEEVNEEEVTPPPPPALRGARNGSPRDAGTNPRRNGTSPRQVERREMARTGDILGALAVRVAEHQARQADPEAAS